MNQVDKRLPTIIRLLPRFLDLKDQIKVSGLCKSTYENRMSYMEDFIVGSNSSIKELSKCQTEIKTLVIKTLVIKHCHREAFECIPDSVQEVIIKGRTRSCLSLFNLNVGTYYKIQLGNRFNDYLLDLPSRIIEITFGHSYNLPLSNKFENLTKITFGRSFNSSVRYLPPNLKTLIFGSKFNRPIDYLPDSITHLELGSDFNQRIDFLPPNLLCLILGLHFNQDVNSLPASLQILVFGHCFDKPVNHKIHGFPSPHPQILPLGLKKLVFGRNFNQQFIPPPNLSYLKVGDLFN